MRTKRKEVVLQCPTLTANWHGDIELLVTLLRLKYVYSPIWIIEVSSCGTVKRAVDKFSTDSEILYKNMRWKKYKALPIVKGNGLLIYITDITALGGPNTITHWQWDPPWIALPWKIILLNSRTEIQLNKNIADMYDYLVCCVSDYRYLFYFKQELFII